MVQTYDEANTLADALDEAGFDVVDTMVGHSGQPASVIVGISELTVRDVTIDEAEIIVDVRKTGPVADAVEIYDEPDHRLTDEQEAVLDEVCDDRYPDPEMTLWEYDPDGVDDNIGTFMDEITEVYENTVG